MTTLIIALHHNQAATDALRAACGDHDVEVLGHVENGLSSAYHAYAARLRQEGRILPALARAFGATRPFDAYDTKLIVSWSAPYALVQDVLEIVADRDALTGIIMLDSGYGPITPGVADFARLARDRRKLYSAFYTDVRTSGYDDSGTFLKHVQLVAGAPKGLFSVEHLAHDEAAYRAKLAGLTGEARSKAASRFWENEHINALHQGPLALAAAFTALGFAGDPAPPSSRRAIPPPPPISRAGGNVLAAPGEPRTLRRGMLGDDIRELQTQLNQLGAKLHVDGDFGGLTEHAVRSFQVLHHVGADGVADKSTRTAIAIELALLVVRTNADTEPPSDDRATEADAMPTSLGLAVLAIAREDLAAGIRETARNDSPEIRRLYLDPAKIPPGSNWCAAALWSWLRRACAGRGVPLPIAGSAGAQATMAQLQKTGRWIPVAHARMNPGLITAGMVPVWSRATERESWLGHIGVTSGPIVGRTFPTIEGNSGPMADRVAAMAARSVDDPKLFGFGRLDVG